MLKDEKYKKLDWDNSDIIKMQIEQLKKWEEEVDWAYESNNKWYEVIDSISEMEADMDDFMSTLPNSDILYDNIED